MASDGQRSSDPARRRSSVEYRGLGQSGYTAGRREDDPSLERELETRNTSFPRSIDPAVISEFGTDDRFTGRGGRALHGDEPAGGPESTGRPGEPVGDIRDPKAPPEPAEVAAERRT